MFYKNRKTIENQNSPSAKILNEEGLIELLKEKGMQSDEIYTLDLKENLTDIRFTYYENMNQIIMQTNREIMWTILLEDHIYSCPTLIDEKENTNEKCKKIIEKDIEKYLK